ncbi:MAG TPA: hypothetical protein VI542_06010 [Candidatus Tectomicrobia bacterium]
MEEAGAEAGATAGPPPDTLGALRRRRCAPLGREQRGRPVFAPCMGECLTKVTLPVRRGVRARGQEPCAVD